jgi:succinate-acetate transporter protein
MTTTAEEQADQRLAERTLILLRPLAGPLTIGFLGLAAATFVLAGLNLGWVKPEEGKQVALCIIAFTVPLQLLASILGFLSRDGVAASGMGLLSGIWLAQGLVLYSSPPGATSRALGLFLLMGMVAMWAPATQALASKLVPATVLFTAGLRFGVTGLYQLSGAHAWKVAAGLVGLVLAALAVYAAYATGLEDALKQTVLPLGRRGKGQEALTGAYPEQIAELVHEPGVRKQL